MALAAGMQAIRAVQRKWATKVPAVAWMGGFIVGLNLSRSAPADAAVILSELNRQTAEASGTSPEVYEQDQMVHVDQILEALESGRLVPDPSNHDQASITRQAALVVEMAYTLTEAVEMPHLDEHQRKLEVSRRMGVYIAGISLGLRLRSAHTVTSAEALNAAIVDYVHEKRGGISPYLRVQVEDLELETVRLIVTGEGFSA